MTKRGDEWVLAERPRADSVLTYTLQAVKQ